MKRIWKWTGIGVGVLVAGLIVVAAVLYIIGDRRLGRRYDVAVAPLVIPTDEAAIARGRHLVEAVTLCHGCHGDDLGGGVLVDDPLIATIYASNLTAGRGGIGARYTDADFVRAIRHGVNPDGRGLMIMHSDAYHHLGREDLAAIIAYVKSVPPVDREVPATHGAPLGKVLVALGLFDRETMPLIAAERIDHAAPLVPAPPAAVTAEYGRYLVSVALCAMCHGRDLRGGPPIEKGMPPAPNIAVYGAPTGWSAEQFLSTLRTGVTPAGRALDPEAMPWEVFGLMTDDELGAIRRYLTTLATP